MQKKNFHLSVVATSRNDNHGGSLTTRMQHFVDGFVAQCIRHDLHAELILVEWNPPKENCSLAEVLHFPQEKGPCEIRIITVPNEIHKTLQHAEHLPLFQMIAKNVGIRRAAGQYVLATNIDILFSDEVIQYIKHHLQEDYLYRVDRLDIPSELPKNATIKQLLDFAKKEAFRVNGKYHTLLKIDNRWVKHKGFITKVAKTYHDLGAHLSSMKDYFKKFKNYIENRIENYFHGLHRNACGDFTLLSKKNWEKLRGYPEWELYSWHIDSVLLYQAMYHGIKEIDLAKDQCVYHIEHHVGSGYTPEDEGALFNRLQAKNIGYISDEDLKKLSIDMKRKKKSKQPICFNNDNWGFQNINFKEVWI